MNEADLLFEALCIAGQFVHDNPPTYVPEDLNYVAFFTADSDPQGLDIVDYWMRVAQKRLKEREQNGMV